MWRYTVLRSSNCTVHVGFCSIQLAAHSLTSGGAESQPVHQRSQTLLQYCLRELTALEQFVTLLFQRREVFA